MRLIDADEIKYGRLNFYSTDGDIPYYKDYAEKLDIDSMPTIDAIPVEWIKQWNDSAWRDNLAMHGWFDRMLWSWEEGRSGRLPGKEQMEDTITVKRDWLERIERQAEKYRDLRDEILTGLEEYQEAADFLEKADGENDKELARLYRAKAQTLKFLSIDIRRENDD